jgi:hypothetical protein
MIGVQFQKRTEQRDDWWMAILLLNSLNLKCLLCSQSSWPLIKTQNYNLFIVSFFKTLWWTLISLPQIFFSNIFKCNNDKLNVSCYIADLTCRDHYLSSTSYIAELTCRDHYLSSATTCRDHYLSSAVSWHYH